MLPAFMEALKKIRIIDIIQETKDTKTFVFTPVDHNPFTYQSGQFITLVFHKHDHEERRSYSLSSAPEINKYPSFTVKRIDNGEYSRHLIDHVKEGDELLTIGASGYFTLPDSYHHQTFFFFAAGSGITPLYSLIKTILTNNATASIFLIYSNRSAESAIFYKPLLQLADEYPSRFTIESLFSSAQDLSKARLGKWQLENLLKKYVAIITDKTLFYLCGPFDYMRMISIVLLREGFKEENIRKENFVIHKPRLREEPPDTEEHLIELVLNNTSYHIKTQFPKTILQKAKEEGIGIPYSCESGQCGTCVATCVNGNVWMSYNEVLTDKELANGRILTCTGYPIEGDIKLTF